MMTRYVLTQWFAIDMMYSMQKPSNTETSSHLVKVTVSSLFTHPAPLKNWCSNCPSSSLCPGILVWDQALLVQGSFLRCVSLASWAVLTANTRYVS